MGRLLLDKRNFEDALKAFSWIYEQNDTHLPTICAIGHCHFTLKQRQEAEAFYVKAMRIAGFSGQPLEDPLVL